MKLNLGCGNRKLPKSEGWINTDKWGAVDYTWDLEKTPWPWPSDSAEEVLLSHVLEHLGQAPATYLAIMRELWRVCRPHARVRVIVPHPRHDHFLNDPTHVRAITPDGLRLFSQRLNKEWEKAGAANSRLGLEHGINFEVVKVEEHPDPAFADLKKTNWGAFQSLSRTAGNVVAEYEIILEVVK